MFLFLIKIFLNSIKEKYSSNQNLDEYTFKEEGSVLKIEIEQKFETYGMFLME